MNTSNISNANADSCANQPSEVRAHREEIIEDLIHKGFDPKAVSILTGYSPALIRQVFEGSAS